MCGLVDDTVLSVDSRRNLRKRWVRQFWLRCRVRPLAASLSYPLIHPQEEAAGYQVS
jgi:hypothetical protein